MQNFTRTIVITKGMIQRYHEGEIRPVGEIVVYGKNVPTTKLERMARKIYGDLPNMIVTDVNEIVEKRTMSFKTFLEHSTVIEDNEEVG